MVEACSAMLPENLHGWPDPEDFFSLASSSIITRVLPYAFLKRKASSLKQWMIILMDVANAFLPSDRGNTNSCHMHQFEWCYRKFGFGRVLPGQRDPSLPFGTRTS